ncbi:hypothetical protein B0T21DRAFT_406078 [Apiosordaria backusii]|uniref:Uncharacterized protein n=1 Tax=Apiosordaria backusii TaxID=314023 RepID=A0AA40K6S3_9PEZI|nr:hypothetical protein B0T21DRAFT_406078 [Apiosordaria backusii]
MLNPDTRVDDGEHILTVDGENMDVVDYAMKHHNDTCHRQWSGMGIMSLIRWDVSRVQYQPFYLRGYIALRALARAPLGCVCLCHLALKQKEDFRLEREVIIQERDNNMIPSHNANMLQDALELCILSDTTEAIWRRRIHERAYEQGLQRVWRYRELMAELESEVP